jgi:hypothetical protein
VAVFGAVPTVTGQEQKIFDFVRSWAWTSSPMTGKTRVLSTVSEVDTAKNLSMRHAYNRLVPGSLFVAQDAPRGVLVAVSERGSAPSRTPSPTEFLARRFARELGVPDLPIVRPTQVHGRRVIEIQEWPGTGQVVDAGPCDALVTRLTGVGLVVQTADCVPILLAAGDALGAVHAGWRGSAANVAGAAADAILGLTEHPDSLRAWLGPAIHPCCYEVGSEVANRFPERFVRHRDGKFALNLPGIVREQLERSGIDRQNITVDPSCTMCGGQRFASYRRDREGAGRMIALVARLG